MKLEHLIQGYNFNRIPAKIQEQMEDKEERAGIIIFGSGMTASYLLDDEDIVIAMRLFFNTLTTDKKTLLNQFNHTTKILEIIQKTIMLLTNIPQNECNTILRQLGLFNNTFRRGKKIKHLNYIYKVETIGGILSISIDEILEKKQTRYPQSNLRAKEA